MQKRTYPVDRIEHDGIGSMAITEDDKAFFARLGARIAEHRKAANITQVQMAEILGISQQTMTSYEMGHRRVSVPALITIARTLGMSLEELVGVEASGKTRRRRGPEPKLARQIEQVRQLPRSQQQFVSQMIDTVLQQQRGQENPRQKTGS